MSVKAFNPASAKASKPKSAKTSVPSVPLVKASKHGKVGTFPPAKVSTLPRSHAPTLLIANRQRTQKIKSRLLKQIVAALFAALKIERAEIGVNLVGANEMARVNWQYLQHEGSTDVITFDHLNSPFAHPPQRCPLSAMVPRRTGYGGRVVRHSSLQLHGELFVCVDDAVKQAAEFRTSWQAEVVRYVVHGVLHLIGHDDARPELRRKMKREENRLVRFLERGFSLRDL